MTNENLSGCDVFVTGADGFIGSHLVEILVKLGANVKALVYYNSWSEIGWLRDIPGSILQEVEVIPGDVRDAEFIAKHAIDSEYIFHLASLIAIPYSYDASRSYVETNINGTLNILNACRKSDKLTRVLHTSTSEVYGSAQFVPISESHPLVGQSPYAATKIGADKIAESYHLSFDVPLVVARPFNTFGPRQTARAVIPTIASQIAAGKSEIQLGTLTPTRDFNFVTDTARGMVALATCPDAVGEVINIGSGQEWSIAQVVEYLIEISGREVTVQTEESRIRPEKSEVNRLLADNSKISAITDWRSSVAFKDGLAKTYDWIKQNLGHFEVNSYAK